MIELKEVSKVFHRNKVEVEALKKINLKVEKGDIFGVIGFSGAGKSTLIRMINYLETPTSGEVIVNNEPLNNLNKKKLRELRKKIGMIFQHFNLLETKTVFENVAIPFILNNTEKELIKEKVDRLLKFVGLEERKDAYPSELSGGQKQRVGIARALATEPLILLCDEATSALDPETTQSILELLKKINKEYNITILIITHEMNVIREICNKVAVMENGKIIEKGNLIDIFANPKEQTTEKFVRTVVHDKIPSSILKQYTPSYDNELLELKFIGQNAKESVIAEASKQNNVDINILYANFTELGDVILGYITTEIRGNKDNINEAIEFMRSKNVNVKEVIQYDDSNLATNL